MYITIDENTYREIRNLSFAPQVDITGDSMPVDEFNVDIKTTDKIAVGQFANLYDDLDQIWAKFWIVFADEVDSGFVTIKAQSPIMLLDRYTLPAIYYDGAAFFGALLLLIVNVDGIVVPYVPSSDLYNTTVTGYAPEQTARERLQWLLMAAGGKIEQSFDERILITPLDQETVTDIPIEKTYWKPDPQYSDYVTSIIVTSYSFEERTPTSDEEYVEVGDDTYVVSQTTFELENQDAPASAPPNPIVVDGMYLINEDNVADIASRLALMYFARTEVNADVINNREYKPSQKVTIQLDEERSATGYIETTDFSFGVQAKSNIKLVGCEVRELTLLRISYIYDHVVVAVKRYNFPVGYAYRVQNPFIDKSSGKHRYIYRPVNEYATGTIVAGVNTNDQDMETALHWYGDEKLLHVISVSDMEYDTEDKVLEIG